MDTHCAVTISLSFILLAAVVQYARVVIVFRSEAVFLAHYLTSSHYSFSIFCAPDLTVIPKKSLASLKE